MSKRISVDLVDRPYLLTFGYAGGGTYPLAREEAQRLVDSYPVLACSASRLTLRADDGRRCYLSPATHGGGPAFLVTRS